MSSQKYSFFEANNSMRKWLIRAVLLLFGLVVIGAVGVVIYWSNPAPAQTTALNALQSTANVTVSDNADQIVFKPPGTPKAGFIFYPGARVSPAAYARIMHGIAEKGYPVFIIKLPLNFALLGINRAADIIAANPAVKVWAVGGHSLGGVAASSFASSTENKNVKGLSLYASYPASSISSNNTLSIVSVSGSNDGLATPAKIADSKALLPANTQYVVIQGGDHAQFGDYGPQDGDNPASISATEQAVQVIEASVVLLDQIAAQSN
jgi:hypothetical protein